MFPHSGEQSACLGRNNAANFGAHGKRIDSTNEYTPEIVSDNKVESEQYCSEIYARAQHLLKVAVVTSNSKVSFQEMTVLAHWREAGGGKKRERNHGTQDSRVVPHRGTN
jgi:hypothetical protein